MMTCNCVKYLDITDRTSLNKRSRDTKAIVDALELIGDIDDSEHRLYKCPSCGQFWQRSLDWMGGNKAYVFKVPVVEVGLWNAKQFVQPDELFNRVGHIQQYFDRVEFEEQEKICKREGCRNRSIKLSVLCALHHLEMIGIKISMPEYYAWFLPYEKENFELSIERLKQLPNYKPYEVEQSDSDRIPNAERTWWQKLFGLE